jgi:methylthioribulose-1-phosphate dehydratase
MDQHLEDNNKLAKLVRDLNILGHNPATSGNYSLRSKTHPEVALVSESGIDKSLFQESNFLPVMIDTKKLHEDYIGSGRKSSDETEIHLSIYQVTKANCVLHSHIMESLLFAEIFKNQNTAVVSGLELLKAFKGVKTHEISIEIPIFDNTQDITKLSIDIKERIKTMDNNYGLIIRGHGIYVWGESIEEAKRHLETFQYLFEYYLRIGNFR